MYRQVSAVPFVPLLLVVLTLGCAGVVQQSIQYYPPDKILVVPQDEELLQVFEVHKAGLTEFIETQQHRGWMSGEFGGTYGFRMNGASLEGSAEGTIVNLNLFMRVALNDLKMPQKKDRVAQVYEEPLTQMLLDLGSRFGDAEDVSSFGLSLTYEHYPFTQEPMTKPTETLVMVVPREAARELAAGNLTPEELFDRSRVTVDGLKFER